MHTLKKIRDHQKAFLKKTKARKESLAFFIEGVNIIVNPGVFPPATDTKLLASHIHITPGERILDLTTGSGIFSIIAGLHFYRKGEDPNNFLIPITTSIADLSNMFILSILVVLFF